MGALVLPQGINDLGPKLTTQFFVLPTLLIHGTLPPPSQDLQGMLFNYAQGQIYNFMWLGTLIMIYHHHVC